MLKRILFISSCGIAALFIYGTTVWSSGFALYEWSAQGVAFGGAALARTDDPSAAAFNPAGITQLEGIHTLFGCNMISPKITAVVTRGSLTTSTDTENLSLFPPHAYLTYQWNDRSWFGFGLYSRFGLSTRFPSNWAGRYNSYDSTVQSYSINPIWAIKATDELSCALGIEAMYFKVDLKNKIADPGFAGGDINSQMTADDLGLGVTLGTHYKPEDWLSFGLTYRSKVTQNLKGKAKFSPSSVSYPLKPSLIFFKNCDGSSNITLPESFSFGVAVTSIKQLSAEFSMIYTGWSSYDKPVIDLSTAPDPTDPASSHQEIKKDWHNTWRYQFGLEYAITAWLDLRAGYVFDESPIDEHHLDYMLPGNDLQHYCLGTGFHWNTWTVDAAYAYIVSKNRHGVVDAEGDPVDRSHTVTFKNGYAHSLMLSIGYALP
ncbi:MAG: outer membrane protein transport protein [bacterium]